VSAGVSTWLPKRCPADSRIADRRAAIYGIVAVVMAMVAGWLASLPFRTA